MTAIDEVGVLGGVADAESNVLSICRRSCAGRTSNRRPSPREEARLDGGDEQMFGVNGQVLGRDQSD
jgi:hypothetical protein